MQNKPFDEKKPTYIESKLFLSSNLQNYDVWNEESIVDRADILSQRALEIWEEPRTEYVKTEDEDVIFDLSDPEISFINTKIVSFKFDSKEYAVASWRDFEKKILEFFYDLDKMPLISLAERYCQDTDYSKKRFSKTEDGLRAPIRVDDDLFVESHYNSDAIVDIVRMVVEAYDFNLDEVEIVLQENKTSKKGIYDYSTLSRVSNDNVKELYEKIDKEIMQFDSSIEKIFNKHYVAYRFEQNFVELHFHVDWLTLYMFPDANYNDFKNKIEYVQDRTWTLTGRLYVRPDDDFDYIIGLIKSSFEYAKSKQTD